MKAVLAGTALVAAAIPAFAQAPAAPTGLTLSQPAAVFRSTTVRLSFTDNASTEQGFKIERKIGAGAFVEIAVISPSAGASVNYDDKTGNVTPGSTVTYRVRAYNASGNSAYTNEPAAVTLGTQAVPAAPTSPTATWGTTGITVSWSHADIGVWACCGTTFENTMFQVWRSESATGPFAEIGGYWNNGTYLDRQWEFNKTYYYKVRGWHYRGFGFFSPVTASVSTPTATTPVAAIVGSATAFTGQAVKFTASTSTYVNDLPRWTGTTLQYPYTWDFGSGEDAGYNMREVAYAFRTPGVKTVTVTVKGPTGLSHSAQLSVTVSDITVSTATPHACTAGESGAVVSAVHRPATWATLQAAIDASVVQNNPLIEMTTGTADYVSGAGASLLLKPNRTGAGWTTIRPLNYSANFINQKRVTSADVANLAKVSLTAANSSDNIIDCLYHATNPVSFYRLQGIQARKTTATESQAIAAGFALVANETLPPSPYVPRSAASAVNNIILQHDYIDGDPQTSWWQYGVHLLGASQISILDSRFVNVKSGSAPESYGISVAAERVVVDNNELYAFSMAIFTTGEESPYSYNMFQRHITARRNYMTRRVADRTNTYFTGGSFNWKNIFELKRGEFVMLFGNVLGPSWFGGAQDGTPILITPANQTCDSMYGRIRFTQIKNNVVRSSNASGAGGTWIDYYSRDGGCDGFGDLSGHHFISNNLFFDGVGGDLPDAYSLINAEVGEYPNWIVSDHNTALMNGGDTLSFGNIEFTSTQEQKINLFYANNLSVSNYVKGGTAGAFGKEALDIYAKAYTFMGSAIQTSTGAHESWVGLDASNKFPATSAAVAWQDYTNRDLRLSGTSPYRAAGTDPATDGTDRGANLTTIYNQLGGTSYSFGVGTTKAESGNWSAETGMTICNWHTNPSCTTY